MSRPFTSFVFTFLPYGGCDDVSRMLASCTVLHHACESHKCSVRNASLVFFPFHARYFCPVSAFTLNVIFECRAQVRHVVPSLLNHLEHHSLHVLQGVVDAGNETSSLRIGFRHA